MNRSLSRLPVYAMVVLLLASGSACGTLESLDAETTATPAASVTRTLRPTRTPTVDASSSEGAATPTIPAAPSGTSRAAPASTPVSPPGYVYYTETPVSPPHVTPTPGPRDDPSSPIWSNTPVYAPGGNVTREDLAARGVGAPGRGPFNIARIIVDQVFVDAPVVARVVEANGMMPSPPDTGTVVWYDFSLFPGLGGLPNAGGNVVLAGDAIKPGQPAGVFVQLGALSNRSIVKLVLTTGNTVCYRTEFNKFAGPDIDFFDIVSATAPESITLITGASPGVWRVVWGPRTNCP